MPLHEICVLWLRNLQLKDGTSFINCHKSKTPPLKMAYLQQLKNYGNFSKFLYKDNIGQESHKSSTHFDICNFMKAVYFCYYLFYFVLIVSDVYRRDFEKVCLVHFPLKLSSSQDLDLRLQIKYKQTRKYALCGYILGVLTHTTALDQLWGGDETLKCDIVNYRTFDNDSRNHKSKILT